METQSAAPGSLFNVYRTLLKLRRELPPLHAGTLTLLEALPPNVLGYERHRDDQTVVVLINFRKRAATVSLERDADLLFGTVEEVRVDGCNAFLSAQSALVARYSANA